MNNITAFVTLLLIFLLVGAYLGSLFGSWATGRSYADELNELEWTKRELEKYKLFYGLPKTTTFPYDQDAEDALTRIIEMNTIDAAPLQPFDQALDDVAERALDQLESARNALNDELDAREDKL